MGKLLSVVVTAVSLFLAVSIVTTSAALASAQQVSNNVGTNFITAWVYESPEDKFINCQVTGHKWWQANLRNNEDDTGSPVKQVSLYIDSSFSFDNFNSQGLASSGPPVYEWLYGDITEGFSVGTHIDLSSNPVPVSFTPGFDASRSANEINFWEESTQKITISLTPRETSEHYYVLVQVEENDMVNPIITSPIDGKGINLSPDGRLLHIEPDSLELNKEWSITVTLKIDPKVSGLQYMPSVIVESMDTIDSGSTTGGAISKTMGEYEDEIGTWTWSSEENCVWNWAEHLYKRVAWHAHTTVEGGGATTAQPEETGNLVYVGFVDSLEYAQEEDSFANTKVNGDRRWRVAHMENIEDETGEPVRNLRIKLDSDITFDWVDGWDNLSIKRGPPKYEWTYGDLGEDYTGHTKDASVLLKDYGGFTEFTPGFDVSRSFDKTVFTEPGTQTVTVTVTPREETFDRVMICVLTGIDQKIISDLVDAVIIAHSDEWYNETDSEDFYAEFGLPKSGIPVELDTPITVTATIQVTPKVTEVEYKSMVHVAPHYSNKESDSGTVQGSSVSLIEEAGTWTVSADGEYVWYWNAVLDPSGSVNLQGQARDISSGSVDALPQVQDDGKGLPITAIVVSTVVVIAGLITYFLLKRRRGRTR